MLLRWFDSREAVAFAKTVVEDIHALFPREVIRNWEN